MTPEEHRRRSCAGKRCFNSIEEAERLARDVSGDKVARKRAGRDRKYVLHGYKCQYCDFFHIGHTNQDYRKPVPPRSMRAKIPPSGFKLIVHPMFVGWGIAHMHPAYTSIVGDNKLAKNEFKVVPHADPSQGI